MQTLDGKTAVVTGGGSGIGRAISISLARSGTHVVVADIQAEAAEVVAHEVRALGVRSLAVQVDVASLPSVEGLAARCYAEFGRVDILCNNAGVSWRPFRTVLGASMADWAFIMGVNLWGVIHGLHAFLPRMREQEGEKHVVNTASIAALVPLAGHMPYSASKAGVASISEALAQELAPERFGVTILCPGFVQTNVTHNSDALRPEAERSTSRSFAPYDNPLLRRLAMSAMEPAVVGTMVCDAIRASTLYLTTQPLPDDIVRERIGVLFPASIEGSP